MNRNALEGGGLLRSEAQEPLRTKSRFSRFIASLLAAVLSLAGLVAVAPGAYAATPGISISTLHNGSPISDGAQVAPGDIFRLRVQYNNTEEGFDASQPVIVEPPAGVTIDEATYTIAGNEALESVTSVDGNIHLNFKDPAEWTVNQGVWDLDFIISEVENPEVQTLEWTVNGEPTSIEVIVVNEGAEQENVSNQLAKSVQNLNLDQHVSVARGVVEIDPAILEETFAYTLIVNSDRDTERQNFTITDQISPYLSYDADSFEATITTWDEIGWNSSTGEFTFAPQIEGNTFTYSGEIPNPSELTVNYTASMAQDQLTALTEAMQAEFDALGGTGNYTVGLSNTVTFGDGTTDNANVNITGNRTEDDGPTEVTDLLDKSAANTNLDSFVSFNQNGDVVLDEAITDHEITYTLTVNTASEEGRPGFTFEDQLSPYLEYNEESFNAQITTWGEGGWDEQTDEFTFTPEFLGNGFTYSTNIPGQSELTITYTASVASGQLDALRDALQIEFDALDVNSGDYRVSLKNTIDFGGEEEHEANVTVGNNRGEGEGPENVSDLVDKVAGTLNLSRFVSVYEGEVSVDDGILDQPINYGLVVNTDGDTQRPNYTIEDQISEFLAYDQDSFKAEITTWDANGWNKKTNAFDHEIDFSDNSFTITGNFVNPSEVAITYSAYVAENQLENLTAALQAKFDELGVGWGSFSMELPNEATFGGETVVDRSVSIGGHLPEPPVPSVDQAFDKNSDIESINITPADDGTLEPPLDVTYTFDVDLTQWGGKAEDGYLNHDDFTLDRNVVITDDLPEQATWNVDADDFITGIELEYAGDFDGDAEAFAADEYIGHYAVVGQNLYINVGADSDTNVEIAVKALINTVLGLTGSSDGGIERLQLDNNAQFIFSNDEDPYTASTSVTLNNWGDGVSDERKFSKTAIDGPAAGEIKAGDSATITYRFEVNRDWSNAVDITESSIIDYHDPNIFDFSDLDQTVESISGTLQNDLQLDASHFDLTVNQDGNLVIAISDDGKAAIENHWASPTAPFVLDLALNTVPIIGKQTLLIENNATLYGSRDEALFVSGTSSEATSYGHEAEVRKSIRDTPNQEWTQNLRVELNEDGSPTQTHFVYNLAFIPHGNYEAVAISSVRDVLPEGMEFIGFVTDDNVDTGDNPVDGPIDIGGNLEAVYADGVVTVQQQEGTLLVKEPNISANVLVNVANAEEDISVVNVFGNSSAIFTPSDGYPISVAKVDSEDEEAVINDPDSRFNVLDDDGEIVIEDAFVVDGQLRVINDEGRTKALVVPEPGVYWVEEVVAPKGYALSTDRIRVVVGLDGSSNQVTFLNDPASYAIGDYVWIDENRDGQQDSDEDPLKGVTVELYTVDEDGVTSEKPIATDTTDENGRYLFDDLDAGDYRVRFILTEEQQRIYTFTDHMEGDTDFDSDAGDDGFSDIITLDGSNNSLDREYADQEFNATEGVDPTWDAGVVERTYAIGDYVWIDDNRDGIQDEDEKPLKGVKVVLYDGDGEEINDTTTDENGRYIFDNLKAGEYSVQFILTEAQAEIYEFTPYTEGDDTTEDSNAGEEGRTGTITLGPDNTFLTADEDYDYNTVEASGGIDPTWDAGVVVIPVPEIQVDKNDSGDDIHQVLAGEHDVTVTITNEGNEPLENFEFNDTTQEGHDVVWNEEDLAGLEELVLAPGGSYTVNGTVQVEAGTTHRDEVVINADGAISGEPVEDDDPTTYEADPTYAIGDYVWVDKNRNGVQDEDEPALDGVTVELYTVDEDGIPSEEPVDSTETDEHGRYIFDNLDAGDYQVRFILTDEQADLYKFTTYTEGDDTTVDSNAGNEGRSGTISLGPDNEFLTVDEDYDYNTVEASGGIDPTWDAGVQFIVQPEIQVDKNDSGDDVHQVTAGEHNVTVTITNAGDEALENFEFNDTTQEGHDVVWNEEDLAGLEELVLKPGDSYTVNGVVQVDAGTTHRDEVVINANGAISGEAVEDDDPTTYEADEAPPTPTEPADPADSATSDGDGSGDKGGKLSKTGANFALIFGALGLLLLVIGIVLYARHRQASKV